MGLEQDLLCSTCNMNWKIFLEVELAFSLSMALSGGSIAQFQAEE